MPTTYDVTRVNRITGWSSSPILATGYQGTPNYSDIAVHSTTSIRPAPSPRAKPIDLSINMTSYNVTFRSLDYCVTKQTQTFSGNVNGIKRIVTRDTYSSDSLVSNVPFAPGVSPNAGLKLRLKMEDRNLNLGGYIGEYKETAALFVGAAKSLHAGWKLIHGRIPKRDRHKFTPHDVSALWVANQFAVQPLVSDVAAAMENLNSQVAKIRTHKFVVTESDSSSISGSLLGGSYTSDRIVSQRIFMYADEAPGHSYIDLGNPLEWAWEAIPFSFVIDWFIPIGDTIGSIDATKGYSNFRGCSVTKDSSIRVLTIPPAKPVGSITTTKSGPSIAHDLNIVRTVLSRGTVPMAGAPRIKNPLSLSHVLTATALLHLLTQKR